MVLDFSRGIEVPRRGFSQHATTRRCALGPGGVKRLGRGRSQQARALAMKSRRTCTLAVPQQPLIGQGQRAVTGLTQKRATRRLCRRGPASEGPLFPLVINQPRDRGQRGLFDDTIGNPRLRESLFDDTPLRGADPPQSLRNRSGGCGLLAGLLSCRDNRVINLPSTNGCKSASRASASSFV